MSGDDRIIAESDAMRRALNQVKAFAPTPAGIFLEGEPGVGKELIARFLHREGLAPFCNGPFVVLHCAAICSSLFQSVLFGTAEDEDRKGRCGLLEEAENGVLLLKDVAELDDWAQYYLAQYLHTRSFSRVGSRISFPAPPVRLFASGSEDLRDLVAAGKLREDLYYRLTPLTIRVPPLRERLEDLEPLAAGFLNRHAKENGKLIEGFEPGVIPLLKSLPWPGNVQQLGNALEKAVIVCETSRISCDDLPAEIFLKEPVKLTTVVTEPKRWELEE